METDVVVIGGGAAGLGVAWDLTLHGLRVTLVEMGDVGTGTSGRYHGRLQTGSRYAASDLKNAKECWQEHTTILCSPPDSGVRILRLRPPRAQRRRRSRIDRLPSDRRHPGKHRSRKEEVAPMSEAEENKTLVRKL